MNHGWWHWLHATQHESARGNHKIAGVMYRPPAPCAADRARRRSRRSVRRVARPPCRCGSPSRSSSCGCGGADRGVAPGGDSRPCCACLGGHGSACTGPGRRGESRPSPPCSAPRASGAGSATAPSRRRRRPGHGCRCAGSRTSRRRDSSAPQAAAAVHRARLPRRARPAAVRSCRVGASPRSPRASAAEPCGRDRCVSVA